MHLGKNDLTKWLAFILCAAFMNAQSLLASECVRVYYDATPGDANASYFGRIHAMFLDNVLGHFPKIQTIISPISKYQAGDVETCKASIYLGTYYDAPIPEAFVKDFIATTKSVTWAGYNIWKLGDVAIAKLWGAKFTGLTTLDSANKDEQGRPGFYRFYSYLGEEFEKYGEWDRTDPHKFNGAFEIAKLQLIDPQITKNVRSWARHTSAQMPNIPYVLESDHHWYIGDSPFSFMVESDRYLIFCDLLFDMLNEQPRRSNGPKPALFRVEDVHPMVPLWQLFHMVDMLKKNSVPFSMTMIPIFTDPFGNQTEDPTDRFVPMTRDSSFRTFINYAGASGGSFIFHGVTHQYGLHLNPFTGMTGDDFEFWDRVKNKPIELDTVNFVQNRLEDGLRLFELSGVKPSAWVAPHYQASPLDYSLFAQLFSWSVGRAIYFPFTRQQTLKIPPELTMDRTMSSGRAERGRFTSDLQVSFDQSKLPNGQFFPYEIFGDAYGQRIIPENVGNVQTFMNEQVFKVLTVDGMIKNLRRNRVLRDAWGSFFVHPFTLEINANEGIGAFPGDVSELERLIHATREYGYEFIDLPSWLRDNTLPLKPPSIEVPP